VSGVVVDLGSVDEVREMQLRRRLDDTATGLSLEAAQRQTVWVARDDATIVGIVVAHDTSDERYIGDWYVEPSFRGGGVGNALLRAAINGRDDLAFAALADSADPSAVALLSRSGIASREPVLRVAGEIPKEEVLAKMAAGDYRFNVEPIDLATHGYALDELDRSARGTTRADDHAAFAIAATGNVFYLGGECVGYAYVWPDGRVGPVACASEAYLVQIFAYAVVMLQRAYRASWCTALIPGSDRRIARAALRAGLRITGILLFNSEAELAKFSNYIGYHELLF
jgi:GNAT superfamily N-acetyltransferase